MKLPPFFRRGSNRPEQSTVPSQVTISQQELLENLAETRRLIGEELAGEVLPESVAVKGLTKQIFQSKTFRAAAYNYMTDRYGQGDRSLTTVDLDTGAQVFVVTGKISSGNPWEVGHAGHGGIDLRQTQTTVYAFDGTNIITEYGAGQKTIFQGELGRPDTLLSHIRQSLGQLVATETFMA